MRALLFCCGTLASSGITRAGAVLAQGTTDQARIVSVEPAQLTRGVPTIVRVHVEVTLASLDSGVVRLGFNDRKLSGFVLTDSARVTRGVRQVTLESEIIPEVTAEPRG